MKKIRTLQAPEIEVRVQSVKNGKANMLLYIDSRAATDLLDETYGMENWTIEYKQVGNYIYGRLSIWDDEHQRWIYREDTGSESNIEANKGLASDIVKRCIVRFGVTELYSSPRITIDDDSYGNSGYKVSEIAYDDNRNITHLVIVNRFCKEVYRWDKGAVTPQQKFKAVIPQENASTDNHSTLKDFCSKKKLEYGVDVDELKRFFLFYKDKAIDWKGKFDAEALYNKWIEKKAA